VVRQERICAEAWEALLVSIVLLRTSLNFRQSARLGLVRASSLSTPLKPAFGSSKELDFKDATRVLQLQLAPKDAL